MRDTQQPVHRHRFTNQAAAEAFVGQLEVEMIVSLAQFGDAVQIARMMLRDIVGVCLILRRDLEIAD